MKISIHTDDSVTETEIVITCNRLTPEIETMLATLRILNQQLTVMKGEEVILLDVSGIIYIETVDRKTFVYTKEAVYESKLKLYEVEARLCESGFIRASKSCLIHLRHIKSLRTDIDRRIRVTFESGEQILVSRQYADDLKKRLGV
ncbi:MAG: LytTR family transcriptional regulator [Clostridiaceae bacterium]|nr:LytTR family transcriptional regulator [Clostridiaceae bacterium]